MAGDPIDLTTAAEVAADLGVTSDAKVERVVTAASMAIAKYMGGEVHRKDGIVEAVKGYGRPRLLLGRPPVLAITSITVGGDALASGDYEVESAEGGMVLRVGGVWPRYGIAPDNITQRPVEELASSEHIVVTYNGGWVTPGQNAEASGPFNGQAVTVPADVREAAIITAVALYRARGADPYIASEALGTFSVSYFAAKAEAGGIPKMARALLDPYVRWRAS